MKAKNVIAFLLAVVIIFACAYIAAFDVTIGGFRVPSTFDKDRGIRQGLDLVGGSVIVFEPDVEDPSTVTQVKYRVNYDKVNVRAKHKEM